MSEKNKEKENQIRWFKSVTKKYSDVLGSSGQEITTPKGSKIRITYHDKFHYTDSTGERKEIEGTELFSDLFDATQILDDIRLSIRQHRFYSKGIHTLSEPQRAKHLIDSIWVEEHFLHNMQFVFDIGGVFNEKNAQQLRQLYDRELGTQFYSVDDHNYINEIYNKIADEGLKEFVTLKAKYLKRVTNLMMITNTSNATLWQTFEHEQPLGLNAKDIPLDVREAELYALVNPDKPQLELTQNMMIMAKDKDLFRTTFNRWWDKIHLEGLPNDWSLRKLSKPWKPIDPTDWYLKLEKQLKNNPVPLVDVLPYNLFGLRVHQVKLNQFLYRHLFAKFKHWFDRKNEKGLIVQLSEIGTREVKIPHMITIDKDFETRVANDNRQKKALEHRIAESEVEKITDMTLEQAQAYVWNNDYPDDIEIV